MVKKTEDQEGDPSRRSSWFKTFWGVRFLQNEVSYCYQCSFPQWFSCLRPRFYQRRHRWSIQKKVQVFDEPACIARCVWHSIRWCVRCPWCHINGWTVAGNSRRILFEWTQQNSWYFGRGQSWRSWSNHQLHAKKLRPHCSRPYPWPFQQCAAWQGLPWGLENWKRCSNT